MALLSNTLISILAYTAEPKARQAGAGALAQVSQRGYGVSLLGDFQNLPGHGPGRAALRFPAEEGAGVDKPRGACPRHQSVIQHRFLFVCARLQSQVMSGHSQITHKSSLALLCASEICLQQNKCEAANITVNTSVFISIQSTPEGRKNPPFTSSQKHGRVVLLNAHFYYAPQQ